MENEQLLLLLRNAGITKTTQVTKIIQPNKSQGVPLGFQKCKAVILRMNNYVFGTNTVNTANYFYWGNQDKQRNEVLRGVNSIVIFCENANEIFVNIPEVVETTVEIEVSIYQ